MRLSWHRLGHRGGEMHRRFFQGVTEPGYSLIWQKELQMCSSKAAVQPRALLSLVKGGERGDRGQRLSILYKCDRAADWQGSALFPSNFARGQKSCVCSPLLFLTIYLSCRLLWPDSPSYTGPSHDKEEEADMFGKGGWPRWGQENHQLER